MKDSMFWQTLFDRAEKYFINSIPTIDRIEIIKIFHRSTENQIINIFKKTIESRKIGQSFPAPSYFLNKVNIPKGIDCNICESGIVFAKNKNLDGELDLNSYNIKFYCNCNNGAIEKRNDELANCLQKISVWDERYLNEFTIRKLYLDNYFKTKKEKNDFMKDYYLQIDIKAAKAQKKNYTAKHANFYLQEIIDLI